MESILSHTFCTISIGCRPYELVLCLTRLYHDYEPMTLFVVLEAVVRNITRMITTMMLLTMGKQGKRYPGQTVFIFFTTIHLTLPGHDREVR